MPNQSSVPFRIDAEFQMLIPPLSDDEAALLEESLATEGCREPLTVWLVPGVMAYCERCEGSQEVDCRFGYMWGHSQDGDKESFLCCVTCGKPLLFDADIDGIEQEEIPCLLLDGYHRFDICERRGIDYEVRVLWEIETRDEAVCWILQNQLARRNLADIDRVALALKLKPMLEEQAKRRQGTRTDLTPNLAESFHREETRDTIADLAGLSHGTVAKAEQILNHGDPEILRTTRAHVLSLHAAVPLTELPKDQQVQALREATQEAAGKKPTAIHTRAVVSRAQVVSTVKEQLAAGKSPQEAVSTALQRHEVILPTPALADAIAQATDRQVTLAATDGLLHDGRTNAEEARAMAETKRMFQLFNALEALATLPDIPSLLAEIPSYSAYRIEQHLAQALINLNTIVLLWKGPALDTLSALKDGDSR